MIDTSTFPAPSFHADRAHAHIVDWLRTYASEAGMKGFVVGVSGGIDSAVTSTLCALTGLPTIVCDMPIHQPADQASRSAEHIAQLTKRFPATVRGEFIDLTAAFEAFKAALPPAQADSSGGLALANSRARLRMATLYAVAQKAGALVAGTGNKVEDFGVGFYTKYGDGGVDLSPIADLTKTEVFALGAALDVPKSILQAAPTDGLWEDDRTDEDQLGASYPELEWAMRFRAGGGQDEKATEAQQKVLATYDRFHRANKHKMEPIPVCVLPTNCRTA